ARYNHIRSGRGSVRLEHSVRDREVEGSNPFAPTNIEGGLIRSFTTFLLSFQVIGGD
ncbi:MAG: hypothetical protein FD147_1889, partial [Chloroflexi bacterium]